MKRQARRSSSHIIQFVDSLPKSSLGKVLRRKLRALEQLQNPAAAAVAHANQAINSLQEQRTSLEPNPAQIVKNADAHDTHAQGSAYTAHLASTAATAFDDEVAKDNSPDHAVVAAQVAEDAADAVPELLRKSAGALALEQLLSSKAEGLGAATETPNIHHHLEKSQLVRSKDDSRLHLGRKSSQDAE